MKDLLSGLVVLIVVAVTVLAIVLLIGFLVRQLFPISVRHTPRVSYVPRKHWTGREDSPSWERQRDEARRMALSIKLKEFAE